MDVIQRLTEDMKTALRGGDKTKLLVVRYLMSLVKNYQIDKPDHSAVTDDEFVKIVKNQVKSTEEAMAQYLAGGRQDLVDEEQGKVALMKEYLPAQMDEEQVKSIVARIHAEQPELAMGPLIGVVMREVGNQADGGVVSRLVRAALGA
jgi:uncharacterized protein YqeY